MEASSGVWITADAPVDQPEQPIAIFNNRAILQSQNIRYTVDLSGGQGAHGRHGANRPRTSTTDGNHGESGQPGSDSYSGWIALSGTAESFQIETKGNCQQFALKGAEIVLIRCIGGDGGNGGDGEDGQNGGNAGHGGGGGHAGDVTIATEFPELLALIEVQMHGGRGGLPGSPGRSHSGGADEVTAQYGSNGSIGSLGFIVETARKTVLEEGSDKFGGRLVCMRINNEHDDRIFEPGYDVVIDTIEIENHGCLDLPRGAILTVRCAENSASTVVPKIKSGERYQLPNPMHLRIARECGSAIVSAELCLVDRLLSTMQGTIQIQNPIMIEKILAPEGLSAGERGVIQVSLRNDGSREYGRHRHDRIDVELEMSTVFRHEPDRHLHRKRLSLSRAILQVYSIAPGAVYHVHFPIEMVAKCSDYLYASLPIRARLYLRGRCAEIGHSRIRCIPDVGLDKSRADVLLMSTSALTQMQYVCWKTICDCLRLSMQIYHLDRDTPDRDLAASSLEKYKMVIGAASNSGDLARFPSQFMAHYLANNPSSAILLAGQIDCQPLTLFLTGYPCLTPVFDERFSSWNLGNQQRHIASRRVRKLQKNDVNYLYHAIVDDEDEGQVSCCGLRRLYGRIIIHRMLYSKQSRLFALPVSFENEVMKPDDDEAGIDKNVLNTENIRGRLLEKSYSLQSPFVRAIMAILQLLPIEDKISLMLSDEEGQSPLQMHFKSGSISVADLALISLSSAVRRDLNSGFDGKLHFSKILSFRFRDETSGSSSATNAGRIAAVFQSAIQRLKWRSMLPWPGRKGFSKQRRILQEAQLASIGGKMTSEIWNEMSHVRSKLPDYESIFSKDMFCPSDFQQAIITLASKLHILPKSGTTILSPADKYVIAEEREEDEKEPIIVQTEHKQERNRAKIARGLLQMRKDRKHQAAETGEPNLEHIL